MNNVTPMKPPGNNKKTSTQNVNPFAQALAEMEKTNYGAKNPANTTEPNNIFSDALAKTGGQIPQENQQDVLKKQADLEKERKKAELRKKLHDQINPVHQEDIFNAQRERTKKELEAVRKELKNLASELTKFYKEVDIQVTQTVVDQGTVGTGLRSYFQKLKAFIILLTKKVRSARTWMRQHQAKQAKKKRKIKGGLLLEGKGAQESKTIFDMMHHERNNAYSGG